MEKIEKILIRIYGYGRYDESSPTRTLKDTMPDIDQARLAILDWFEGMLPEEPYCSCIIELKARLEEERK